MLTQTTISSAPPRGRRAALILAGTIAALLAPRASAATIVYDGGPSGTGSALNVAANWVDDVLPTTTSEVLFDNTRIPPPQLFAGANLVYGDLIWNHNASSAITIDTGTATSNTITLSGGGGSTAAIAAGGATDDLLVMGSEAVSNTLTIGGNAGVGTGRLNLVLGKSGNFDVVNSGATLNLTSIISGAFSVNKTGAGSLTLAGANTFGSATSNFTLTSGTVNINAAAALGNVGNTFVINGGTIDNTSNTAVTTGAYKQTWNADFAFTGTQNLTFGAGVTTLGTAAGTSRTVTVQATTLTLGGVIANGATANSIIKAGPGILALNGISTFTGGVTIKQGTAIGGVAAAFGTGPITLGDTVGSNDAALRVGTAVVVANPINLASGSTGNNLTIGTVSGGGSPTFSGAISLGHDLMVSQASINLMTLSGIISETGGARSIVVNGGSGTVIISNNNTFTGGVTLNSGRLQVGTLNSTGTGPFTIAGGSLDNASGGVNAVLNNSNYLWNSDFAFRGTLQVTLATGNVILGGNRIVTATNVNAVTGSSLVVSGGIGDGGNGYSLTKRGVGGLTLNGGNTYSGATVVQEGVFNLTGAGSTLANTASVTVTGGTLTLGTTTGAGVANRINPAATLTLGGSGIFMLNAGATTPVNSQSFASLAVAAGSGQLSTGSITNAGTFAFTGAAGAVYTRALGGTVRLVVGTNTSFTNAPTGSSTAGAGANAILVGAVTGTSATPSAITDFAKAAAGPVAFATYGTNLWATGVNTNLTAPLTVSGDTQSLRFNTLSNLTTTLTGTSTIESGGILLSSAAVGGGTITGGTLQAASGRDLWIYTSTAATNPRGLTIQSLIGDNGASILTKTGAGRLTLANAANTYAGGTYLGEGILNISNAGALGTGPLNFTGNATLQAVEASLNLGTRAITVATGQVATFDSNGTTNTITAAGVISGAGGLTKTGQGTMMLTNANTYTGATVVAGGTLHLDFSAANAPLSDITPVSSLLNPGSGSFLVNSASSQTVLIQGREATANSQTFGGAYTNILGNDQTVGVLVSRGMSHLNFFAGSNGGTLTVNLGTISRGYSNDVNSNLDITLGAGVTATTTNAAGLLGSYATVNGSTWANVAGGLIVPFTGYVTSYSSSGSVLDVGNGGTLTVNPSSLRFNEPAGAAVQLGAGVVRNLVGGGILVTANVGGNLSTIASGTLTGLSARDLVIHQNNTAGDLQIDASIVDVGARPMAISKNGLGKVLLTASNTATGAAFINEGTVVVTGEAVAAFAKTASATAGSAVLAVSDTTGIYLGQSVTQATALTAGSITWTVVAINPGVSVTLSNNATAALTNGSFTFGAGGGLGGGTASAHIVALGANLDLGNGGTTGSILPGQTILNNGIFTINRSNDFTFATAVSGLGSLDKQGASNTTLSIASTFTGDTRIFGGSLILSGVATNLQSSTLDYSGYGGSLSFGALAAATLGGLKGNQNLPLLNANNAAVALTVGGNHQDTIYSGALSGLGSVNKTGGGTLTLSGANSYGGGTTLTQGTLNLMGTFTEPGAISVTGGVLNLSGTHARSTYSTTAGLAVAGGIFNLTGTLGSAAAPIAQTEFRGNSVTNISGNLFASGVSSTFRIAEATSATVNLTAGSVTIGAASSGVILGRNGAAASGFLNISGGTFTLTGNANSVRIGAGFADTEQSGASVLTLSGTGRFETGTTTGTFLLGSNLAGNSASSGTLNLDGGTLATLRTITGGTVGGAIVNFNGGTFRANGASAAVNLGALGTANVRNGGAVFDTGGFNITLAQALRHSGIAGDNALDGGLTKNGAGTLTLSGASTFNGSVTINVGTLLVSGSLAGETGVSGVSVADGATLASGATGTIKTGGSLGIDGSLAPGNVGTAGTLTLELATGQLNFLSDSSFKFDLGATTAVSDRVSFASVGDWLGGSGNVTLALNGIGAGIDYGATYTLFQNVSTVGFEFASITGYDNAAYLAGVARSGNDYVLGFTAVPEPGSLVTLVGGVGLLLGLRRLRRRTR